MKRWALGIGAGLLAMACGNVTTQSDTDSPIVFITSPKADSTVGGTVAFSAQALDGFGVDSVVFTVDGAPVGVDITSPFGVQWNTRSYGNGVHALRATAFDPAKNTGFASISVTVDNTKN